MKQHKLSPVRQVRVDALVQEIKRLTSRRQREVALSALKRILCRSYDSWDVRELKQAVDDCVNGGCGELLYKDGWFYLDVFHPAVHEDASVVAKAGDGTNDE